MLLPRASLARSRLFALVLGSFALAGAGMLVSCKTAPRANILVHNGDAVAFLGDSNTREGRHGPHGYIHLVVAALQANGIEISPIPAGYGGDSSGKTLTRLQPDVLSKKPVWMLLSTGTNDVWETPLNDLPQPAAGAFRRNITSIIDEAQKAGVRPLLATIPPMNDSLRSTANVRMAPFNAFLRQFAAERKLPLADVNAVLLTRFQQAPTAAAAALTGDGIHLTPEGHRLFARAVLQAMGLTPEQIDRAEELRGPK
jgi:lysophospholipase L1-like esterase